MVTILKDERKVVDFSIAVNDYYKQKDVVKGVQTTLFINCAYWINPTISTRLTKGTLVELIGRVQLNANNGFDGEARATLNCHVNTIRIHLSVKKADAPVIQALIAEDLPF